MLETILNGELPSVTFRRLVEGDSSMTNIRLSQIFRQEFPNVDSLAGQLLWGWMRPGKAQGLSDESLDVELLKMLKDAGYL